MSYSRLLSAVSRHNKESFHWLSDTQLRAALAYAEAYPEEIEERIRRDEQWMPEPVWERYPFMYPKGSEG